MVPLIQIVNNLNPYDFNIIKHKILNFDTYPSSTVHTDEPIFAKFEIHMT